MSLAAITKRKKQNKKCVTTFWQDGQSSVLYHFSRALLCFYEGPCGFSISNNNSIWYQPFTERHQQWYLNSGFKRHENHSASLFSHFFLAWMVTYLPNSPTETEWGPFSAGRGAISKITSYYLKDISSLLLNYNAPTIGLYTRLFFPEKMANNFGYLSLTEMG